jgi:hypothetical protein
MSFPGRERYSCKLCDWTLDVTWPTEPLLLHLQARDLELELRDHMTSRHTAPAVLGRAAA